MTSKPEVVVRVRVLEVVEIETDAQFVYYDSTTSDVLARMPKTKEPGAVVRPPRPEQLRTQAEDARKERVTNLDNILDEHNKDSKVSTDGVQTQGSD